MGGVFANFPDYQKHSMVIQDLVTHQWPVVYHEKETAILTYYYGQYLIPSLFGKLMNSTIVAELSMGVFGWVGVLLLYLNLLFATDANNRKKQIWLFFLFILFSGMLMPLQIASQMKTILHEGLHLHSLNPHWFNWNLQYRSTLTAIKWVYPQYIIPGIGAILVYWNKDSFNNMALFILPSFICGTWGFLCLVIMILLMYVITCIKQKRLILEIFSVQNVLTVFVGSVFLAYFIGNLMNEKPDYMKLHLMTNPKYYVMAALPFGLFMFGFYVLLIWKQYKNDALFLSVVIVLTLIPCFKMGWYNDFVMCTSMPALFILSMYIFKFIFDSNLNLKFVKQRKITLCFCLLLACTSPLKELELSLNSLPYRASLPLRTFLPKRTLSCYVGHEADVEDECMKYNYFAYDFENTFFYKYLARK